MTWEDNRRGASSEDGFIIADGVPTDLIPRNIHWHDNYMHSFTKDGVKIANLKKAITAVSSLPEEGDTEVFYRLYPGDETHEAGIYYWDGEEYHLVGYSGDSDVVDIVNTYADLQNYPTSSLNDRDIIKVLSDETHDGKIAYYRWNKSSAVWDFIGAQGPYYTTSQTDELLSKKEDKKSYSSLERNGEYLYTVSFDELPEYEPLLNSDVAGACSSFVRDGKLYRNLDWNYDESLSFKVVTKDFEGIAFNSDLTSSNLDSEKIGQLPYHIVDGVNRNGIMVSTHVLYNDWEWAGTGDIELTKLPYEVLTKVKSMSTISTDLSGTLSNLTAPEHMGDYLIQLLVTDGTTTYVIAPSETTGVYELIDATSNPKLTNFRWVSSAQVQRANLQTRPTGVERWNLIGNDTELEDLKFTAAYIAPTRLSEFIGINGTTKDSTDAELEAIYDEAHAEYEIRTRDGKLWQTMHSVVYSGSGIENLYVQEDWGKDYVYATRTELAEAAKNIGGGVKPLTTADYNYPENNPDGIAWWMLQDGKYYCTTRLRIYNQPLSSSNRNANTILQVSRTENADNAIVFFINQLSDVVAYYKKDGSNFTREYQIATGLVKNDLTAENEGYVLDARQGKILKDLADTKASKDLIDSLDATPTESTVGVLGQIKSVVSAGSVAAYLLTSIDDADPSNVRYIWERLSTSNDTPSVKAIIEPQIKAMVVPEDTAIKDESLDMFSFISEVEENVVRI